MSLLAGENLGYGRSMNAVVVVDRLRAILPGKNLYELAETHGVTVYKSGVRNKGWVGQTIERVAELPVSNAQRRDGSDFELKSTVLLRRGASWVPKETIKVTNLNPKNILEETFENSALWNKLERLVVVGYTNLSSDDCRAVFVNRVDITEARLVMALKSFWEDVRHTVCNGEMASFPNLGSSVDYLQLRPTGTGKLSSRCPVTGEMFPARAFYATKRLLQEILK